MIRSLGMLLALVLSTSVMSMEKQQLAIESVESNIYQLFKQQKQLLETFGKDSNDWDKIKSLNVQIGEKLQFTDKIDSNVISQIALIEAADMYSDRMFLGYLHWGSFNLLIDKTQKLLSVKDLTDKVKTKHSLVIYDCMMKYIKNFHQKSPLSGEKCISDCATYTKFIGGLQNLNIIKNKQEEKEFLSNRDLIEKDFIEDKFVIKDNSFLEKLVDFKKTLPNYQIKNVIIKKPPEQFFTERKDGTKMMVIACGHKQNKTTTFADSLGLDGSEIHKHQNCYCVDPNPFLEPDIIGYTENLVQYFKQYKNQFDIVYCEGWFDQSFPQLAFICLKKGGYFVVNSKQTLQNCPSLNLFKDMQTFFIDGYIFDELIKDMKKSNHYGQMPSIANVEKLYEQIRTQPVEHDEEFLEFMNADKYEKYIQNLKTLKEKQRTEVNFRLAFNEYINMYKALKAIHPFFEFGITSGACTIAKK